MITTKVKKTETYSLSITIDGFSSEAEARSVASALQYKVSCNDTVLALCTGEVPQAIKNHWMPHVGVNAIRVERLGRTDK